MEKYAWKAKILPNMHDEYIRRHDDIWPEMTELLREAGIRNYSIWMMGDDLFGYYECELGAKHAAKVQSESPIVSKWGEYMRDVMVMEKDPVTKAQPLMKQVFYLE